MIYLTLDPIGHVAEGQPLATAGTGEITEYAVRGLPPGETAKISLIHHRWQIFWQHGERPGAWEGQFSRAEEARGFLEQEVNAPPDPKQPCLQCGTAMQPRRHYPTTGNSADLANLKPVNTWRCGKCGHEIPRG